MRIALLSNVTVEVLAGLLKKEHDLWLPTGFGAWVETALLPPASLRDFDPEVVFLLLDGSHGTYRLEDVETAKRALEGSFPKVTVVVPDLGDLADEVGVFYDERMWKLGAMPWSMKGLRAIAAEIVRLCGLLKGGVKKVLALDLDNTLWRGVVGEDGVAGIIPNVEFQREVKALQRRGVLLVALSKNNVEDVEPVWRDSRMILGKEDFVDLRLNWETKAENLSASARALNLGTDSYVFIDDNPAEREQMKALHPEVAVPDWPVNLRRMERIYFPEFRVTDEDRKKTEQYQAETRRQALKARAVDLNAYLKGLGLWCDVHAVRAEELPRVAQLSQKTNQFNVCTNRYSVDQVAEFSSAADHVLLSAHAGDRFGEQGLVAFVHAVVTGKVARIVDWVMSCRAMNRRLEYAVEESLESVLLARGVSRVEACWKRTLKNAPVARLFDGFDFQCVRAEEDRRDYVLVLPCSRALVHYAKMKG